jgi:hypothetical protein
MSNQKVVTVILLGVALSVLVGWGTPPIEMKLNLAPKSETVYKVVTGFSGNVNFIQPSINKTKESHKSGTLGMVFKQRVESVDQQGNAVVNITIKQLSYFSETLKGVVADFNSLREKDKSDPLMKLIGASYKIRISPRGTVKVLDASAARSILKEGSAAAVATGLFSDEEIARRHQVMALFDADKADKYVSEKDRQKKIKADSSRKKSDSKTSKAVKKGLCEKGNQWSSLAASPTGMIMPKSFDKAYTLTDLKKQDNQMIAVIDMNAVPSSKRADKQEKESTIGASASKFLIDDKDNYTGKMIFNLTTGEIQSYQELLVEKVAVVPREEQKSDSDKDSDQVAMGFTYLYSIKKVN